MIWLTQVTVSGRSELGDFEGTMQFGKGLQVISGPNHFGKSLIATSIAWCLGLEPIFGLRDNDNSKFPVAVKSAIDLGPDRDVRVTRSEASIEIQRSDGCLVRVTRPILGRSSEVRVAEYDRSRTLLRTSVLSARQRTMADETAGLQRFLFEWTGMPRAPVATANGDVKELYLENLAPLFLIDQSEGWTDLQSMQVFRYRLQDISQVAVEYFLGALASIEGRVIKQRVASRTARLKEDAARLASEVQSLFRRQGWEVDFSDHGSVDQLRNRWRSPTLLSIAEREFNFDHSAEEARYSRRVRELRTALSTSNVDPNSRTASSEASMAVVELKTKRHTLREDLRKAQMALADQRQLEESLAHRIHAAKDVFRLKTEGLGRLDHVECPTCHRTLAPADFDLNSQSRASVEAHIGALTRDKQLVASNIVSAEKLISGIAVELGATDERLREHERALSLVNEAVGAVREQLAKLATDLAAAERELEKSKTLVKEFQTLQEALDRWIRLAADEQMVEQFDEDLQHRKKEFEGDLQVLLSALGHSALSEGRTVHLDSSYVPYLGPWRLRALGSASDQARLIAAYVLALRTASLGVRGPHPGFVLLDEPLQQNPDSHHRRLFIDFLVSDAARHQPGQTIILTSLNEREVSRLKGRGVKVNPEPGEHFLQRVHLLSR